MTRSCRIGQIVPSSNTTMESEIPAVLRARESHRARALHLPFKPEELAQMDGDSDRCALELADARVDVLGYACLVAIMSMGKGYHRVSEARLHLRTVEAGGPAPVVTSAGALGGRGRRLGLRADAFAGFGAGDRGPCRFAGGVVIDLHHLHDVEETRAEDVRSGLRLVALGPLLSLRIFHRPHDTGDNPP